MAGKKNAQLNKEKIKRQIEILGFTLSAKKIDGGFFLDLYKYSEPQFGRDLNALREQGVDIHSSKKSIELLNPVDPHRLHEFILTYLGYCTSRDSYDKATTALIRKHKADSLALVVQTQFAIDTGKKIVFRYQKDREDKSTERRVAPLMLFQAENEWRILAEDDRIRKQFILQKISDVRVTNETFEKPKREELRRLFANMWGGWLGEPVHTVTLHFSPRWSNRLAFRVFTENDRVTMHKDGSMTLQVGVPQLSEVASWVVSRGEGVTVLAPEKLKEDVIRLAKGALANYGAA